MSRFYYAEPQDVRWPVDDATYYRDASAVSQSMLKDFARSPALYRARYVQKTIPPSEPSAAMRLGSALHAAVLQPDRYTDMVAVAPADINKRTNAGKAEWAAFEAAAAGKSIITADEAHTVQAMAAAIQAHPLAANLLDQPRETEIALRWTDAPTGMELKAKLDGVVPPGRLSYPLVLDLKTANDPRPDPFARHANDLAYQIQQSHYAEAASLLFGSSAIMIFVAVQNSPPFDVWVHRMDDAFERIGEQQRRAALDGLAAAMKTDNWWAIGQDELSTISPPAWALRQLEAV